MLNISSYAAGTRPWGTKGPADGFGSPSLNDCLLEVVGFADAWEMAKGQMGLGHALRIAQCRTATIVMSRALPVQVCVYMFVWMNICILEYACVCVCPSVLR